MNQINSTLISKSKYIGEITCIYQYKNIFLIAQGPVLHIHKSNYMPSDRIYTKDYILSIRIFQSERINHIKSYGNFIFFIGENKIKYIKNIENDLFFLKINQLQINDYTLISNDWILDMVYDNENENENENGNMIVGYTNNYIDIYNSEKVIVFRAYNSSKCIIYSMNIVKLSSTTYLIASGSVFHKIFLWKVCVLPLNHSKDIKEIGSISDIGNIINKNHTLLPISYVVPSLLELTSHLGVIFKVKIYTSEIDSSSIYICSCSDDRQIIFWKVNSSLIHLSPLSINSNIINENITKKVFLGHTSRIWNIVFVEDLNRIISVGEDNTCRVYDTLSLNEVKTLSSHSGKSIRSLYYNHHERMLYSGGDDGKVYAYEIFQRNDLEINTEVKANLPNDDKEKYGYIKNISVVSSDEILVGTSKGYVLIYYTYKINDNDCELLRIKHENTISVQSEITLMIYKNNKIYIGNSAGEVIIYNHKPDTKLSNADEAFKTKVFHMKISHMSILNNLIKNDNSSSVMMIICNPACDLKLITNKYEIYEYHIKDNVKNQISSSCIIDYVNDNINNITNTHTKYKNQDKNENVILLIGDIKGKLFCYVINKESMKIITFSSYKPHKDVITSITQKNNLVFTTSKDGFIKGFSFSFQHLNEIYSKGKIPSISLIFSYSPEIIIGSHGTNLVLYDIHNDETVYNNNINGLNRVFDYKIDEVKNFLYAYVSGTSLVFNKNMILKRRESLQIACLQRVSGKIIHSIRLVKTSDDEYFILTASEDIQINIYKSFQSSIEYMSCMKIHIGAIRYIEILFVNKENSEILFSSMGASCEYYIHIYNYSSNSFKEGIVNLSYSSNILDARILYSQYLRSSHCLCFVDSLNDYYICNIYENIIYNEEIVIENTNRSNSNHVNSVSYTKRRFSIDFPYISLCFTLIPVETNRIYSVNCTSNGNILLFEIVTLVNGDYSFDLLSTHHIHEAGINSISYFSFQNTIDNTYIFYIFTSGEDHSSKVNQLVFSDSTLRYNDSFEEVSLKHDSSVKSNRLMKINNDQVVFFSTGYDQMINVYRIIFNEKRVLLCEKAYTYSSCVSEINSLDAIINKSIQDDLYKFTISVCGHGFEVFDIDINK